LWDILDGKLVYTLSIEDGVTTVAMSPDGHYVAAGSLDKSVRVWDTTTGYLVERLENPDGHKDSVYSVAFAPNGRDLVSGSLDKTIKLWELTVPRGMHPHSGVKGGKCIRTFEGHKVCVHQSRSTQFVDHLSSRFMPPMISPWNGRATRQPQWIHSLTFTGY
jgi:glucose repression regulatory protein TUP1